MNIVFKCDNKECELAPCLLSCRKAFQDGEFGDESVSVPETCPYMEYSDQEPAFRFVRHEFTPDFGSLEVLENWYSENSWDLPEELQNAIDNCEFSGHKARMTYREIAYFANLLRYECEDIDSWNLSDRIDKVCEKYKKREVLIASLETGYRLGLMQAARIMFEKNKEDNK